jgi:hypothetical protein
MNSAHHFDRQPATASNRARKTRRLPSIPASPAPGLPGPAGHLGGIATQLFKHGMKQNRVPTLTGTASRLGKGFPRSRAPLVVSAKTIRAEGASSNTAISEWTPLGGITTDAADVGAIPRIRVTRRTQRLRPQAAGASRASSLRTGRTGRDRAGPNPSTKAPRTQRNRRIATALALSVPVTGDTV